MIEIAAGKSIFAAQIYATNTATDAMVMRRVRDGHGQCTWTLTLVNRWLSYLP